MRTFSVLNNVLLLHPTALLLPPPPTPHEANFQRRSPSQIKIREILFLQLLNYVLNCRRKKISENLKKCGEKVFWLTNFAGKKGCACMASMLCRTSNQVRWADDLLMKSLIISFVVVVIAQPKYKLEARRRRRERPCKLCARHVSMLAKKGREKVYYGPCLPLQNLIERAPPSTIRRTHAPYFGANKRPSSSKFACSLTGRAVSRNKKGFPSIFRKISPIKFRKKEFLAVIWERTLNVVSN